MEMAEQQFNAFARLLPDQLREADAERDQEKRGGKMKKLLDNPQKPLED